MPGVPFRTPQVADNSDGWGPTTVPEDLKDVPYAPFGKGDKLGRVSDFSAQGFNKQFGRYPNRMDPINPVFNFFHNEEEDQFHLVDSKPVVKGRGQRRFQPSRYQQRREQAEKRGEPVDKQQQRRKQDQNRGRFNWRDQQRQTQYSSSVDVRPDWRVVEQINFPALTKLSLAVAEPQEVAFCGELAYYDKALDRVTPKSDKRLVKSARVSRATTASEDPIIKKAIADNAAKVYATDTTLTALMTAPRSVYPWDLLVHKKDGVLFLDVRPGSSLEMLTVAETAPEAVPDDKDNVNGIQQLSTEATAINHNFTQQALLQTGDKFKPDGVQPNPFAEGVDPATLSAAAYRYRKWTIADGVDVLARCEVDGAINFKGQDCLLSVKTLNEFDSKFTGIDWRQKLESQRGAVLATELKNNACKLARWTAQSLLSGADLIKLGFVSRAMPRDTNNHMILGTQNAKPRDFAAQINLNIDNCWGIVRAIVDLMLKQEDGKYLLIKDPNKPMLRIYEVPAEAFEAHYDEGADEGDAEDAQDEE